MKALLLAVVVFAAACSGGDTNLDGSADDVDTASIATAPEETAAVTTDATPASSSPATTEPTPATTAAPTEPVVQPARTVDELLALGRPIVLAHAGGEDEFPHSTPFAYANSVAAGVDMLDLDVQLTGDGVLVVHHDSDVDRTTDGTGDVASMTFDELHALDNAYWFAEDCVCRDRPESAYVYRGIGTGAVAPPDGATPDDFAVARFRDIVERWPDMPLNIEIKGNGAPAVAAAEVLAAELTELDRLDASVVTSFDDAVVSAFAEFAPTVELTPGLALSSAWVLDGTPLPDGMRILQVPPEYEGLQVLTPEMIAASKAAGYLIWVWPNDRSWENADGYRELLEMGMDGLNINFPALGVAAVRAFVSTAGPTSLEAMDALIPVVELETGTTGSAGVYFGSSAPSGGSVGPVDGFMPAADDQRFCWAVQVINARPQPIDEFEEVVVANEYFRAIEPYAPADMVDPLAALIEYVERIVEQGSFGEPDEVDGGPLADALSTVNAMVDERCLGLT